MSAAVEFVTAALLVLAVGGLLMVFTEWLFTS